MKRLIGIVLLLSTTCLVHANIGETSEKIKKRYGRQDRIVSMEGMTRLEWNNYKGFRLKVYMKHRNRKFICVREEFRLQDGKDMSKKDAKKILDNYYSKSKKDQWKYSGKKTTTMRGTKMTMQNTLFTGKNGVFAVYSLVHNASALAKEAPKDSFVVFMDVLAYADYNKQFTDMAPEAL